MRKTINYIGSGILTILLVVAINQNIKSQNANTLRLNEILVYNNSNAVDDFGEHSSWIELFNSSYNTVNIGGCFLTDDLKNPTKYWIPTGDPVTKIAGRNYIVFWADNHPTHGIFHLNFNLGENKTIALFDANGKTLIDKIEIPAGQKPDLTYGRPFNDSNEWVYLEKSTPVANNDYTKKKSAGESFVEMDTFGIGMTMIAMSVVFMALAILYFIYKASGRFFIRRGAASKKLASGETSLSVKHGEEEMSGEVNAAIAMALHLYQSEMHDFENTVLTIQKVSRTYSPWSSKIHTLRKTPNKI